MRKLLVFMLLLLPAIRCDARGEVVSTEGARPHVKNPRFLQVLPDKTPADWQFFSEGTGSGRCELLAEDVTKYVRVTRETGGDYTGVRQRLDGYTVDPSKDYYLSGEYSSPVEGLAHPCVYYLNENGQFLGAYEFTLPASDHKRNFKRYFRPHPGTRMFEIQLRAQGKIGEVRFYGCDLFEGNLTREISTVKDEAIKVPASAGKTRYAILNPGTTLKVTLLGDTGVEAYASYGSLTETQSDYPRVPVAVDGESLEPFRVVHGMRTEWRRLCEPDKGRCAVEISAPDDWSAFPLLVCLRPVKGERLKPLAVEFGGWEAGNFAPKAQWIGDSEKLIAEDVDLTTAEMMRSLTDGGRHPYVVLDSLTKPIKGDVVRQYVLGNEKPVFEAHLQAAKGESEAFQVVLLPSADGKPARISGVRCSSLRGKGATIPSSAVQVFRVGYVDTPWGERIPDPLFTDLKQGDPKDPLVLMADVRVPRDAKPGEYTGSLRMVVNGRSTEVPIKLAVRDFAVPEENHLRTCFWFFRAQIMHHYSLWYEPTWQQASKYLDMALNYRITPIDCNEGRVEPLYKVWREDDGTYSIDWTEFDAFAEYVLARGGNVLHMAPTQWFGKYFSDALKDAYNPQKSLDRSTKIVRWIAPPYLSDEHKKFLQWYLKEACDHFEKKGWLKYAYLQPFDEVGENPEVLSILRTCEEADPRVKILMDVLRPGDSKPMTEMIDIWCPLSPNLPGGGFEQVRKEGDEVWWYVCIGPKKPYANLFTNWSMTEHRQLFWQSWKYQAQGLLYWGLNFWNWWGTEKPYDKATAWPAGKWSSSTTSSDTVGDGYFIYPGPNGPLPSLRLQAMLDGIEDYEYLWLLNDLVKKAEAKGVPASELAKAKGLLAVPESFCKSLTEYSTKPEDLTSLRDQVAREIERLIRKLR